MGEVFRETLSEEEEEDFRLEGIGIHCFLPKGSEVGKGHLVYLMPQVPSRKPANQVEEGRTLTLVGGGWGEKKEGSVASHRSTPGVDSDHPGSHPGPAPC